MFGLYGGDLLTFYLIFLCICAGMVVVGVLMLLFKKSGGGVLALVGFILAVSLIFFIPPII